MVTNSLEKRRLIHPRISLALVMADVIAMCISLLLANLTFMVVKTYLAIEPLAGNTGHVHNLMFLLFCPFVLIYFLSKGQYTQRVPWWSQVQILLRACAIAFVFDGFSRFALDMSVSRLITGLSWIYLFFIIMLFRQIVFMGFQRSGLWNIPVVAIGDIDTVTNLLFAFHTDRYTGYNVKTVLLRDDKDKSFDLDTLPLRYTNLEVIRENLDYSDYIRSNLDKFFIVSLETFRGQDRDDITNALIKAKALFAIAPSSSRINSYEMEPRHFFGYDIMLLHARKPLLSFLGRTLKRAMDISASALALLLLSPILIGVAVCLKLEGQGGTIFYGGERIGRGGQKFRCWKFRSMEPNSDHLLHALLESDPQAKADWELYRKLKQDDPRITTKTAKIIRKTSIDELPQIWNVLIGDMSLVGPRPILQDEVEMYGDAIEDYLKVRPGITGLWQVSGRNDTTFQRRVYWDSWYVRNWSLWGDIVILIKTFGVVFGRKGAF